MAKSSTVLAVRYAYLFLSTPQISSFHLPPIVPSRRSMFMSSSSLTSSMFEVEQKFALSNGLESMELKLQNLGFTKMRRVHITDWYFDLPEPALTPTDNWLRYRESGKEGTWQLKMGQLQHSDGGITVYHEIEGDQAIQESINMLPSMRTFESPTPIEYEGHEVPLLPDPQCGLVPFARIVTTRSSWSLDDLTVDLDGTDFGYLVGEVELVVDTKDKIAPAKQRILEFLEQLLPDTANLDIAIGKLEHYLINNRPEHYAACVKGGSIIDKR